MTALCLCTESGHVGKIEKNFKKNLKNLQRNGILNCIYGERPERRFFK